MSPFTPEREKSHISEPSPLHPSFGGNSKVQTRRKLFGKN
jgi:hypothetical protein